MLDGARTLRNCHLLLFKPVFVVVCGVISQHAEIVQCGHVQEPSFDARRGGKNEIFVF